MSHIIILNGKTILAWDFITIQQWFVDQLLKPSFFTNKHNQFLCQKALDFMSKPSEHIMVKRR